MNPDRTYEFQREWEDMDPTQAHINKQAEEIKRLRADNCAAYQRGLADAAALLINQAARADEPFRSSLRLAAERICALCVNRGE